MSGLSKRWFRFIALTMGALYSSLLAGCAAVDGPMTTFQVHADNARAVRDLNNVLAIAALLVFVVVEGMLVYSVFRYRRRPGDGIPLQIHGNKPIEIVWTIIPALIVLFLATLTFRTQAI